jgi:hypothetical protein
MALAPRLNPDDAALVAGLLAEAMARTSDSDTRRAQARGLQALAVRFNPQEIRPRTYALASAVGNAGSPHGPFAALPALAEASRPPPARFTEQQLVDLLKAPTCPAPARQAIAEQLGRQCGRPFADEWQFVEWAREHRPDLDLTSPPIRPTLPSR